MAFFGSFRLAFRTSLFMPMVIETVFNPCGGLKVEVNYFLARCFLLLHCVYCVCSEVVDIC